MKTLTAVLLQPLLLAPQTDYELLREIHSRVNDAEISCPGSRAGCRILELPGN